MKDLSVTHIAKARELLACPFCGGTDGDLVQGFTRATVDFAFWSVECIRCGAEIASDTSQDEADEHWNTRTIARPEAVEEGVTQTDRDAPADLCSLDEARRILARQADDHMLVQAFRRHRLGLTSPDRGE